MLVALILSTPGAMAQDGGTYLGQTGGSAEPTPDFYVIQAGDTLWDISTRFLGNAYQWPELWSYNDYITNPHWIYPGNRIYFKLGTQLDTPGVQLEEPATVAEPYVPPEQPRPVAESLCDFPPRFDSTRKSVRLSVQGVLGESRDFNIRGNVYAAEVNGLAVGEPSFVYLQMDNTDDIECGELLSIYQRQGRRLRTTNGAVGYVHRVLATVRVIRIDDKTLTAELRESYAEIERGDVVGDAMPVDVEVDLGAPEGDIEARMIARLTDEQIFPSTGEVVFLDRGTNDGLDVGETLYMVERRDGMADRESKEDKRLPDRVIGRVVVARAGESVSTGVIVDAAKEFSDDVRFVAAPNPE